MDHSRVWGRLKEWPGLMLVLVFVSQVVGAARELCEAGYDVSGWFFLIYPSDWIMTYHSELSLHLPRLPLTPLPLLWSGVAQVTVYVLSAWPSSEQRHLFEDALLCYRHVHFYIDR